MWAAAFCMRVLDKVKFPDPFGIVVVVFSLAKGADNRFTGVSSPSSSDDGVLAQLVAKNSQTADDIYGVIANLKASFNRLVTRKVCSDGSVALIVKSANQVFKLNWRSLSAKAQKQLKPDMTEEEICAVVTRPVGTKVTSYPEFGEEERKGNG